MNTTPCLKGSGQAHHASAFSLYGGIGLEDLYFSAKIDFVTLEGANRPVPSGMEGRCIWPRRYGGNRMTIHDPTASDLALLSGAFPVARVVQIEVAVDIRYKAADAAETAQVLPVVFSELCAKRLHPCMPGELSSGFRGSYIRLASGFKLAPFNRRIPGPTESLLYNTKYDGLQTKSYLKTTDHGAQLPWTQHVVRVEVRLNPRGLARHQLERIGDLLGFAYRKQLSPYFRTFRATERTSARRAKQCSPVLKLIDARLQHGDDDLWETQGVGAFLRGGRRHSHRIRLVRDQALNDRFGQALHRLQKQLAAVKFVCDGEAPGREGPVSMRGSAPSGKSSITYLSDIHLPY